MMHELRMYVSSDVRLGFVLGRHPKINLFGLHYCVICCEVETKYSVMVEPYIPRHQMGVIFEFISLSCIQSSVRTNSDFQCHF